MTSRERWTVYPLLFLTLGIAVKDKLTRTVHTDHIVAKSLFLTDKPQNGTIRSNPGQLVCLSAVVVDSDYESQVILSTNPQGGLVSTIGKQFPDVSMGHLEGPRGPIAGYVYTFPNNNIVTMHGVPPFGERRPKRRSQSEAKPAAKDEKDRSADEPDATSGNDKPAAAEPASTERANPARDED